MVLLIRAARRLVVPSLSDARPAAGKRSTSANVDGIDGMRAVAASMVVLVHVWRYGSPHGQPTDLGPLNRFMPQLSAGVLLFFTLSGFLLYRPHAAAVLRAGRGPRLHRYVRNRALRILPAYWAVLVAVEFVFGAALVRSEAGALVVGPLRDEPATLAANVALVQGYHPSTLLTGIGPAWSLVVEVAFYAALPLLGWIGLRAARGRARPGRAGAALVPPLILLAVGISAKVALPIIGDGDGWSASWYSVAARSFLASADLFAFGMVLAVVRLQVEDGRWRIVASVRAALVVAGTALALCAVFVFDGELGEPQYDTIAALAIALVLVPALATTSPSPRARRVLRVLDSRCFVAVGLVSYSLFLWHEPIVRWLSARGWARGGGYSGFVRDLVLVVVLAGLLSALTYRFVERPALARKRSVDRDPSKRRQPRGAAKS